MKIPLYICNQTCTYKDGKSVSFIKDIKHSVCYVLKGQMSVLWNYIVSTPDYNRIKEFIVKNNIEIDLDAFLYELNKRNIIEHNVKKITNAREYPIFTIRFQDKNYNYFLKQRAQFIEQNKIIDSLYLELNYKCNLKCKHCCNPKDMDKYEINFEAAKRIIDEARETGTGAICLTGGECTINADFLRIAKYIKEKHLELVFLTNAQKLYDKPDLLEEIINLSPSAIKISLYSMTPEIHDAITGVNASHHKTLSVIKELRQKNIDIQIKCPMLSYNHDSYKSVKEFGESIGADVDVYTIFIYNKQNHNIKAKLDKKYIEKFYIDTINKNSEIGNFVESDCAVCRAGTTELSIMPNLDITPCTYFNYKLGNYNTISLLEIKNVILPKFRKIFIRTNMKECFKHKYCQYCNYCSSNISYETGFLKKSKILCENAKAYYNAVKKLNLI